MKKITLFILAALSLMVQSFSEIRPDLKSSLYGEWFYKGSLIKTAYKKVETDTNLPVERIVFKPCDDKVELKNVPSVKKLRQNNVLKNLMCVTYNDQQQIDTYFPVMDALNARNNDVHIYNHGRKYKSEYYIYKLSKDTLIVYDDKTITVKKVSYTSVKHLYTRTE